MFGMLTSSSFWVSFVLISCLPYGMYLVAYLLESRKPGNGPDDTPLWRDQSKAFLPGDFGLSMLLAVSYYLQVGKGTPWWMAWVGLAIGWLVYKLARRFTYTPLDYTRRAWRSPSKRYHDLVMYVGFVALLVWIGIPAYFTSWSDGVAVRLLGIAGLLVWILCMVKDLTGEEVPNDRQHPTFYRPIWQKS